MKFLIVAVGQRMPAWVDAAYGDYVRRMPRESPVKLVEVKAEPRGENYDVERVVEAEGRRIDAATPGDAYKVLLDERGRMLSTAQLSELLARWQMDGRDVAFTIGGADGVAAGLRREADLTWSLSKLTLPHGLVRVVVAEQLYRAASILKNHPYHRA